MPNFVRENKVLLIGIALPIIMVIIFGLALLLPKYFVEPPKYDLLFVLTRDLDRVKANVVNGKLNVQFVCKQYNCKNTDYDKTQSIYYYHVKDGKLDKIPFVIPIVPPDANTYSTEIKIPQLDNLTLNPSPISPDGYQFKVDNNYNPGLLGEVFYSRHAFKPTISKNGNIVVIPLAPLYYYYRQVQFIGWVTSK